MASTNTHNVLAEIAVRANALVSPQPAVLQTTYTTRPLTTSDFDSSVFPFDGIKDAFQTTEERIAKAISDNKIHSWRAFLSSTMANLAHNAVIPSVDSTGKQIIGVYGDVLDATNNRKLTWKPASYVDRRVNLASIFVIPTYNYNIDGDRVKHTRTNVKIKVCIYDRATQRTAIDNNTAMLLPDACEEALVAGAVSILVRDDEFMAQAQVFRGYFESFLAEIRQGMIPKAA